MQISNNYLSSKSINNPNFKAIRNIKCEGFFENNSVCADALLEALAKNEKAKNFIGKYDVDIVLNSFEKTKDTVISSIQVLYKNPAQSKIKNYLDLLFNNKNSFSIYAIGNDSYQDEALWKSMERLFTMMKSGKTTMFCELGLLDSKIDSANKRIEEGLAKKKCIFRI